MATEIIYLGHDNTVDLRLEADGVATDLANVTKITISIGSDLIVSTDSAAGLITWAEAGYDTGEIRMELGGQDLTPGRYDAPLIVYDAANITGIMWGTVAFEVEDEVEAA
jgi:hypothetical protein